MFFPKFIFFAIAASILIASFATGLICQKGVQGADRWPKQWPVLIRDDEVMMSRHCEHSCMKAICEIPGPAPFVIYGCSFAPHIEEWKLDRDGRHCLRLAHAARLSGAQHRECMKRVQFLNYCKRTYCDTNGCNGFPERKVFQLPNPGSMRRVTYQVSSSGTPVKVMPPKTTTAKPKQSETSSSTDDENTDGMPFGNMVAILTTTPGTRATKSTAMKGISIRYSKPSKTVSKTKKAKYGNTAMALLLDQQNMEPANSSAYNRQKPSVKMAAFSASRSVPRVVPNTVVMIDILLLAALAVFADANRQVV